MLRSNFCPCWHETVWSTHVEIHFVSLLAYEGNAKHMLRCILCPSWHGMILVNACWDATFGLWLRGIIFNTFWGAFCVLAVIGGVRSTHVEMNIVFSLAWVGMLNTWWDNFFIYAYMGRVWSARVDSFCVLVGMGCDWSTHVEMHYMLSLAYEVFAHYMLRCIFVLVVMG